MERVVYLLGAGFSAPLGIPVMSQFLMRSRDLYFSDPELFRHFDEVFRQIAKLSVIKNYFESDLYNIEEILSILEMQAQLEGSDLADQFKDYIADTIRHYTPPFKEVQRAGNWWKQVLGEAQTRPYVAFAGALLNLTFFSRTPSNIVIGWSRMPEDVHYDVITLNYDLVLEDAAKFIHTTYEGNHDLCFSRSPGEAGTSTLDPPWLLKLHGSVDLGKIVPPTWRKEVNQGIQREWNLAHQLLRDANHIRVIGYSLPEADSYVRYLLKSSVVQSKHLKSFDVICRDVQGSDVRRRYNRFLTFAYNRFEDAGVEGYLGLLADGATPSHPTNPETFQMDLRVLERTHEDFMRRAGPA